MINYSQRRRCEMQAHLSILTLILLDWIGQIKSIRCVLKLFIILLRFILWLWWIAVVNQCWSVVVLYVCKSPAAQQTKNFVFRAWVILFMFIIWSKYSLVYLSQIYVRIYRSPQHLQVKLLESVCVILWARMQWLSAFTIYSSRLRMHAYFSTSTACG